MTENNCIQKSCERSALLIKIAELEAQLEDMQQHAKVSGDIIKVAVKAQIDAEFELAKFHPCEEGECRDGIQGIYHPAKVYHKEGGMTHERDRCHDGECCSDSDCI